MAVENGKTETFSVNKEDLGRLLRLFRNRRDETRNDVETRIQELIKRNKRRARLLFSGGVGSLEGGRRALGLTVADLELLAEAYQIPRLMLDPLLVNVKEPSCVIQKRVGLRSIASSLDGRHGVDVEYQLPQARLQKADMAIVHLHMKVGGHSTVHSHPGDELLLVLRGSVEVRFAGSGLWTRLDQGDYVHFYAEQDHGAWNIGTEPADLLVIRFYQLGISGTRYEFLNQLNDKNRENRVTERAIRETIAALKPGTVLGKNPGGVADRIGLARLLPMFCTAEVQPDQKPVSLQELARRAQAVGLKFSRARFDRLHQGLAAVSVDDLPKLAAVYGIEPLLLYDFVYPAWTTAIAVRGQSDFEPIPADILTGKNVRYLVPAQRLANSDISIVRLEIEQGGKTPVNSHPGHELLVPVEGSVKIDIAGLTATATAGEHLFVHFHSGAKHQLLHAGNEPAKLFVIRFYE